MILMKWFRKNKRWMMAILVSFLMIGFGLPSLVNRGQQSARVQEMGTYTDQSGKRRAMTTNMLRNASLELEILRSLGISLIISPQFSLFSVNPATNQPRIPGIGAVHPVTELAVYQLLFADNRAVLLNQLYLDQLFQRSEWFIDAERSELISAKIKQLTASESNMARIYYLLLLEEANHASWTPSTQQVDVLLQVRQHLLGITPLPSIQSLKNQYSITDNDIRRILANFLAIIRYADLIANPLIVSEPQIKKTVRDRFESNTVTGSYVTFTAERFKKQLKDPDQEQLQSHFLAYADTAPRRFTDDNPSGFGYRLDDRLQVEYLRVDLEQARTLIDREYEKMSTAQREEKIQHYWKENRRLFQQPIPPSENPENTTPGFRDPDFDEVADQAAELWKEDQAAQRAGQILTRAKASLQKIPDDPLNPDDLSARAAEFEDFAKTHNDSHPLKVTYLKSEFLSNDTINLIPDFDRTVQQQRNQPDRSLLNILFNSEPLNQPQERSITLEAPLRLYEPLDQLTALAFDGNPVALFLVRLVAVDLARSPQALDDDGRNGPYHPGKTPLEQSRVYQNVLRDYQNLHAYLQTQNYAHSFTKSAQDDWDKALLASNLNLAGLDEPNQLDPFTKPLRLATLQQTRQTRQQFLQLTNNPDNPPSSLIIDAIRRQTDMLFEAMQLAQDRRTNPTENFALLERPKEFTVMVFRDLSIEAPYQNEYIRQKPFVASDTLWTRQALAALVHFNPDNIEKRNSYTETTNTP
ncbi:MAG: hypothetical protein IID32_01780 [Planctomycetes bacterium]|nr:hypothetical protein [Planctomycetota bacterium]